VRGGVGVQAMAVAWIGQERLEGGSVVRCAWRRSGGVAAAACCRVPAAAAAPPSSWGRALAGALGFAGLPSGDY